MSYEEKSAKGNDLFELAGYLVTCATMALSGDREGSPSYSANRFLITLRKVIELNKHFEYLKADPFLEKIEEKLDDITLEFKDLQRLQMEFAKEASKRIDEINE